jgi:seryl-tRNA(Sec) selenium transferase
MAHKPKSRKKAVMLGLGLDSDGHKRVTTGPNFALVGGTQETHECMTEKAVKINEKLAAKGKQLHELSRDEFEEIAHSVGLKRGGEKEV